MSEPLYELRKVRAQRRRQLVFAGVSLTVHAGEFWCLVGPNGHGKTTLLLTLLGTLPPAAGSCLRRGDAAMPPRVAFVPQHLAILPTLPLSVREFVETGLVGIAVKRSERRQRVAEALEEVGLQQPGESFWSLSGGNRQRALLARALVRRARILLVDEPTNNLDAAAEMALLENLSRKNKDEGVTIVLVTHSPGITQRYASHVALVSRGRVQSGPRWQVLTTAALQEAFGAEYSA